MLPFLWSNTILSGLFLFMQILLRINFLCSREFFYARALNPHPELFAMVGNWMRCVLAKWNWSLIAHHLISLNQFPDRPRRPRARRGPWVTSLFGPGMDNNWTGTQASRRLVLLSLLIKCLQGIRDSSCETLSTQAEARSFVKINLNFRLDIDLWFTLIIKTKRASLS